ncbi:MAG TPA: PGPGW domain-containing protein [Candidatus Sulfotelmatobacter sp.]|nr:PGPGW domain-containing protein [Candidatus Sulfotelmatobacter sp.]
MRAKAKKVARLFVGWGFILLGMVGLFVPFLQGVLFLIVGLLILSSEYVWANRLLQKIRTRFPGLSARFEEAAANGQKWMSRRFHHTQRDVSGETTETLP